MPNTCLQRGVICPLCLKPKYFEKTLLYSKTVSWCNNIILLFKTQIQWPWHFGLPFGNISHNSDRIWRLLRPDTGQRSTLAERRTANQKRSSGREEEDSQSEEDQAGFSPYRNSYWHESNNSVVTTSGKDQCGLSLYLRLWKRMFVPNTSPQSHQSHQSHMYVWASVVGSLYYILFVVHHFFTSFFPGRTVSDSTFGERERGGGGFSDN